MTMPPKFMMRLMAVSILVSIGWSGSVTARERHLHRSLVVHRRVEPQIKATPILLPIDPTGTVVLQTPFFEETVDGLPPTVIRVPHYQGPDGSYDSLADLSNSIQGTPCGQECTNSSLIRWGYPPAF